VPEWFSPGTPVFSTNKADRDDITEILLSPDASSKGTIEMGFVRPSVRVLGFQMITCE